MFASITQALNDLGAIRKVDFEGTWQRQGSTTKAVITGKKLTWLGTGNVSPVDYPKPKEIVMHLEGSAYPGKLDDLDGKLHWADGDIWFCIQDGNAPAKGQGYPEKAGTPSQSGGAPAASNDTAVLRKDLARLQAEMAEESGFRQEAITNGKLLKEMKEEARLAQDCEVKTSEAANSMLREFMASESLSAGGMASSEMAWYEKATSKEKALTESQTEAASLTAQLKRAEGTLGAMHQGQVRKNELRKARLARPKDVWPLQEMLRHNIAREMRTAREGMILMKVDQAHKEKKDRLVSLKDDNGKFRLEWGHPPAGWSVSSFVGLANPLALKSNTKMVLGATSLVNTSQTLEFKDVIRLEFGRASRGWVLNPGALPWLCFSLYTTDRSFDFICPDEWAVQVFVLACSRMCPGVNGAINSKRKFQTLKGWCKVEDSCTKAKVSLPKRLLQALKDCSPEDDEDDTKPKGKALNPFTFCPGGGGSPFDEEDDDDDDGE